MENIIKKSLFSFVTTEWSRSSLVTIGLMDFCVSDTVWFPMISGDLRCCFRSFPVGYNDGSVMILADTVTFRLFSFDGICGKSPE